MMKKLLFALLLAAGPVAWAQQPQVPHLTATSLQRGNSIARGSSGARVVGGASSFTTFKETSRIAAVKVLLRSFSKPTAPYEVQCFFCAKDLAKSRYIFDVKRVWSEMVFDEINIFGRDLFGGAETTDQTRVAEEIITTTPEGELVTGKLITTVRLTSATPGSTLEGWIVRVISGGKVVRMEASLHELKAFAERESALLDRVATQVPVLP